MFSPDTALREISVFDKPDYPSFSGKGSFHVSGADRPFSGIILLALDKDRYRLEVISKTGAVVLAVAGGSEEAVRIDPATGEKSFHDKSLVFLTENLSIPASFLRSMITGSAPLFDGIKSTSIKNGSRIVKAINPRMDFYYTNRLEKIIYHPADGGLLRLALGPMKNGTLTPFVSSAEISYGKLTIAVRWEDEVQGRGFPDGFFKFDEPI